MYAVELHMPTPTHVTQEYVYGYFISNAKTVDFKLSFVVIPTTTTSVVAPIICHKPEESTVCF